MKRNLKRGIALLLSLLLLTSFTSCTSMEDLEKNLEQLELAEKITAYYRETKSEREALRTRMNDGFGCNLSEKIVRGFEVYGEKSGRRAWIYEFENN